MAQASPLKTADASVLGRPGEDLSPGCVMKWVVCRMRPIDVSSLSGVIGVTDNPTFNDARKCSKSMVSACDEPGSVVTIGIWSVLCAKNSASAARPSGENGTCPRRSPAGLKQLPRRSNFLNSDQLTTRCFCCDFSFADI